MDTTELNSKIQEFYNKCSLLGIPEPVLKIDGGKVRLISWADVSGTVLIPEFISSISSYAFSNNDKIQQVKGLGVKSIDYQAFAYCTGLKTIDFPNLTVIKQLAFFHCTALEECNIPSVKGIGNGSFVSCNIEVLNLPSIEKIAEKAFSGCHRLRVVKFGSKLKYIKEKIFEKCKAIREVTLLSRPEIDNPEINAFARFIDIAARNKPDFKVHCREEDRAYYNRIFECDRWGILYREEIMALGVKDIAVEAYGYGCVRLNTLSCKQTNVVLPKFITDIGDYCFKKCKGIKTVRGESVIKIGIGAFANCTELISADFSNAKIVNAFAFSLCRSLENIHLPRLDILSKSTFSFCENLTEATFENVYEIENNCFDNCCNLERLTFGRKLEIVNEGFLSNCRKLSVLSFQSRVTFKSDNIKDMLPAEYLSSDKTEFICNEKDIDYYNNLLFWG